MTSTTLRTMYGFFLQVRDGQLRILTVPCDLLISPSTIDVPTIPRSIIYRDSIFLFRYAWMNVCIPTPLSGDEILSSLHRMIRRKEEEQTRKVLVDL